MKPTIGRNVLFRPAPGVTHAAIITAVHSNTMVNLVVFDAYGVSSGKTSVQLVSPGQDKPEFGQFCEWMPYQVAQAAKQSEPVLFPIERQTADALVRIVHKLEKKFDELE